MRRELTTKEAEAVFNILVAKAGASDRQRAEFVHYLTSKNLVSHWEFRFGGSLGMGGKLYYDGERLRVGCYREDDTPQRDEVITDTNKALQGIRGLL